MTKKNTATKSKISKILIANRGEIACRIIRTCQSMGIASVVLYSEADKDLPFVQLAAESYPLEGSESRDTYLNIPKIVELCQALEVDAVHPGYGFLSENAEFAEALAKVGITFIGPSPQAIRSMGSKSEAKAIAEKLKVPTIQGYRGEDQTLATLRREADRIGFPILIKATHGGGGKGMRRVDGAGEFDAALASCQREAQGAFGNASVMLEKYVVNPRHIEVQVFGDTHGHVITLSERDCSLQRRHQKVVEEAPAAGLSEKLRGALHRDAISIAKDVSYTGAGTVEFLVDTEGNYYFLEMNTRLQVEHPVTEMVLGLDLVALQIAVAQGESLASQDLEKLAPQGHALEVRLYAEDPTQQFLPSIGKITRLEAPQGAHVRFDGGYRVGNTVSIYYDPMLAKLIVHGADRREAYARLQDALIDLKVEGVKSNRDFLLRLTTLAEVVENLPSIAYLDENLDHIIEPAEITPPVAMLLAYALKCARPLRGTSPWDVGDDWRLGGMGSSKLTFEAAGSTHFVDLGKTQAYYDREVFNIGPGAVDDGEVRFIWEGDGLRARLVDFEEGTVKVILDGQIHTATIIDADHHQDFEEDRSSQLNAPMPGRVISVIAKAGQSVEEGEPLLILEAMKMEHTIRAPYSGVVERVLFTTGDFVEEGVELAVVKAA